MLQAGAGKNEHYCTMTKRHMCAQRAVNKAHGLFCERCTSPCFGGVNPTGDIKWSFFTCGSHRILSYPPIYSTYKCEDKFKLHPTFQNAWGVIGKRETVVRGAESCMWIYPTMCADTCAKFAQFWIEICQFMGSAVVDNNNVNTIKQSVWNLNAVPHLFMHAWHKVVNRNQAHTMNSFLMYMHITQHTTPIKQTPHGISIVILYSLFILFLCVSMIRDASKICPRCLLHLAQTNRLHPATSRPRT